ncbi:MAG TPA: 16S rRNA (uracil(1498)-N(3))-methyltransferase [Dehalococcoidia bacterium]|jgi:16S rRNA (uracil1498-N3)-methyltransferase|nr:16S rRNA (uracil(1498)-N(3))-methyltransferase [Dehalococcoidia bacterium]HIK89110.1 16S rRNA (uracil(1498)-N(3))-methyltransferase [Dehalococcoidia bacterium]
MHRFYVPDIDATDRSITLDGPVARQLKTVLRVEAGEHVRFFDGSGSEWEVEVDDVGKSEISTTLISAVNPVPEPSVKVTMLLGLARAERIELAIQKCTELGAVRFVPVMSERVQGGNASAPSDKRLERWQRIAIEAAEQSGRAIVPVVESPMPIMVAVGQAIAEQPLLCMWEEVGDESVSLKSTLKSLDPSTTGLAALIGPPGGFSEQEATAIREAGANLVTLGARVLRSETAAITVMSAILYELGDLGG